MAQKKGLNVWKEYRQKKAKKWAKFVQNLISYPIVNTVKS